MKFNAFQHLYQQVKSYDLRLFDCFRIIENYIQQLVGALPDNIDSAPLVSFQSANLNLTNVFQLVPNLAISLPHEGTWLIEYNGLIVCDIVDTYISVMLTQGAASKNVAGGKFINDALGFAPPATVQLHFSKSWIYTSTHQNDIMQIQATKLAGAGISAMSNLDPSGNQCSSLKALYLGNYAN